MKKFFTAGLALLFVAGTIFISQPKETLAANIEESQSQIRVFIGNTNQMTTDELSNYNTLQNQALNNYSEQTPYTYGTALVTFDDFISANELESVLQGHGTVKFVYIWEPNKVGRCIIKVQNNNVAAAIDQYFQSLDLNNEPASKYRDDMMSLMENYGIFAIELSDTYSNLESLSMEDTINRVDLIYSEQAEKLALDTGKPTSYICIPDKPDGTA